MNRETTIKRNPDMLSVDMDGETVMMSIENGNYFGINAVGSFIWERLESDQTIKSICNAVSEHFNVANMDNLENEIITYIEDLEDQNMLISGKEASS